jgi:hypothetical protein
MAISFTKYVDIVSGVGAGAVVRLRDLIGRLFSTNPLIPTKTVIEFDSADEVLAYFGPTSVEYARALFYFGWVSKLITRANKIAFARWADAATAPQIFGYVHPQSVGAWTGISDGSFTLSLGGTSHTFSALDFTGATTLAGVATIIQTAIRTQTGSMWTAAVVEYDAVRGSFNFTGGVTGVASVAVATPPTGTNILSNTYLGWTSSGIFSNGVEIETVVESVSESAAASNNFGSFLFMDALSLGEITSLAAWNTTQNVLFQYMVPVLADDAQDYFDALSDYSGVAMTETGIAGQYPEMVPMIILAATDYTRVNSVQNYMFQQFALAPTVTTDAKSDQLDAVRVNYYGRTQTAGQQIDFYQRGVLTGLATAPTDMNVYGNEQWLKDSAGAGIMTLLLSLARVSANVQGRSEILTTLQDTIDAALNNGVISVGKALTTIQKLYISTVTGDDNAWHQVQAIGYWIDCVIESYVTVDDRTEYKAVYILVYAKDDAIRKVEGTHTLI